MENIHKSQSNLKIPAIIISLIIHSIIILIFYRYKLNFELGNGLIGLTGDLNKKVTFLKTKITKDKNQTKKDYVKINQAEISKKLFVDTHLDSFLSSQSGENVSKHEASNKKSNQVQAQGIEKSKSRTKTKLSEKINQNTINPAKTNIIETITSGSNNTNISDTTTQYDKNKIDQAGSKNSSKRKNSAQIATFMQGFRESYSREQSFFNENNLKPAKRIENASSEINDRVNEWRLAGFYKKINEAFRKSAILMPSIYLKINNEIRKDILIEILIKKDGSKEIISFESTGNIQIDNYIKDFINSTEAIPIPNRFKIDTYKYSLRIYVNLDASTGFCGFRAGNSGLLMG